LHNDRLSSWFLKNALPKWQNTRNCKVLLHF
jgi:hypothetical protein